MVAMSDIAASAPLATAINDNDYELVLFKGKEAYVYQVPPAGTVRTYCNWYLAIEMLPTRSKICYLAGFCIADFKIDNGSWFRFYLCRLDIAQKLGM
jgi:hypothetical protein